MVQGNQFDLERYIMRGGGGGGGSGAGGGEIVQVQGGHIVRSTARKDRHSKVYTSKGPKDRRVRLSAHTAIQFYDVQDRLGYDRPSKAVDWLIRNARPAIDKLPELPPWLPPGASAAGDSGNIASSMETGGTSADSSKDMMKFMPPHQLLDSVSQPAVMDTNMSSRKDLGLSLYSFQQVPKQQEQSAPPFGAGTARFGFEAGGDNDNYHYPRSEPDWSNDRPSTRDEFSFNNNQLGLASSGYTFPQRGTLQSSFFSPPLHHQQPFRFTGYFGSDGFPGPYIQAQLHDDDGVEGRDEAALPRLPPSSAYAYGLSPFGRESSKRV